MTRIIAIISCIIVTLFLVPIQGECSEIPEYELETEIECCVVASSLYQSQVAEELSKYPLASDTVRRHVCVNAKIQNKAFHLPARLLNCVFRE